MKPEIHDLLTTAAIGRMIGTSRQYAHFLTQHSTSFPEPIGKLGHYMVWWRPEIDAWIERHYTPALRARLNPHYRAAA